ncbi:family 43 glycosylhydrolase [Bifidobacterium biavatii]|uniref:Alpha-N-arabinofuranosidase n=1 Tax=Bifidobacterium biavatii DSM 23969 TaxID=1437608 RepID=A0A086ZLU4_9BIFI|nr:family 43 glycosylhydrolase [Bifidobacterium biavatii]KFI47494.1 alpha-N-arabinofuranosidase [Bifidobacterium biavatii DSM 23969]
MSTRLLRGIRAIAAATAAALLLTGCSILPSSAGAGSSAGTTNSMSDVRNGNMITNGLDAAGADPAIIHYHGSYYYVKVDNGTIVLVKSNWLGDISTGETATVLEEGNGLEQYWAPELHRLDGAWYIYVAAQKVGDTIHRTYVLSNHADDPMSGEWQIEPMGGMDDKFAIDATVVETKRGRWLVWSGWEGYENVQQNLYIARMVSPVEVKSEKILISEPDHDWERVGDPKVNEGPAAIVHGDTVNLTYSASGSWTDDYCIGLLTASATADLSDPSAWTKHDKPILSKGHGIYGPGHNSFVESPDGRQTLMIYHSARWSGGGWNRSVRFQPVTFDKNGAIEPMDIQYSNQMVPVPSGEPERTRALPDDIDIPESNRDDVTVVKDGLAVSGKAIGGLEDASRSVSWTFDVPKDGDYSLFVWNRMEKLRDESETSDVTLTVDDGEGMTKTIYQTAYYQPTGMRVRLTAGRHTLKVSFNSIGNPVRVDRMELMPSDK